MFFGTHVDDVPFVHTRCHDGKILVYFTGNITVVYALKFSGWQRVIGGNVRVIDHDGYSTVTVDCVHLIEQTVHQHEGRQAQQSERKKTKKSKRRSL